MHMRNGSGRFDFRQILDSRLGWIKQDRFQHPLESSGGVPGLRDGNESTLINIQRFLTAVADRDPMHTP